MMTTNLFAIADVKQLRTDGSFIILLPFFRIFWCVGVLNSAIFNSFHNRVEFGTILEGLRNFGGGGVLNNPPPPSVRHWKPVLRHFGHCALLNANCNAFSYTNVMSLCCKGTFWKFSIDHESKFLRVSIFLRL